MSSFTLNTKEAIGDFNKYDKKAQERLGKTLKTYAFIAQGKQIGILHRKVITWTGRLATSIRVQKAGEFTYDIGPNANAIEYAWYIEAGAAASQKAIGNNFAGYHYVRSSLKRIKRKFMRQLKRDVERS